jgi:hypothetical protein
MDFDKILTILVSHWAFLAVAIILAIIGEVSKGIVLGEDKSNADKNLFTKLYTKTLPLHPIIAGALLGLALSATVPDFVMTGGMIGSVLYFAVSGALSSTIYNILKIIKPQIVSALRVWIANLAGKTPAEKSKKKEEKQETEEPQDGV